MVSGCVTKDETVLVVSCSELAPLAEVEAFSGRRGLRGFRESRSVGEMIGQSDILKHNSLDDDAWSLEIFLS
jgi:hypothetical protein